METLSMSKKEIDQIPVFEDLNKKVIKQKVAAQILSLSIRQIKRKLKNYRRFGAQSLIHGNRGKPGNRQLDPSLVEQALSLIENRYPDFAPTFASEKLAENHQIIINRESLRQRMIKAGLWFAKPKKVRHRQWRERKTCLGELVQLDGSLHHWLEDRAPACTLLAFIDDATSRILYIEFVNEETTATVMRATKSYLERFGRPLELYVDRGKVFRVNLNNPDEEKITQYRRAMDELGVKITYASSPQAKGRVERLFGTLQDRLIKELRLAGISTIEEANRLAQDIYLVKHNQKFAVEPKENTNLHRSIEGYQLEEIFNRREERILTNDFTIRYHNQWFQLDKKQPTLVFPRNTITVVKYLDGKIKLKIRRAELNFREINKPVSRIKTLPIKSKKTKKPWIPAVDHPWRKFNIHYQQKVTFLNC